MGEWVALVAACAMLLEGNDAAAVTAAALATVLVMVARVVMVE